MRLDKRPHLLLLLLLLLLGFVATPASCQEADGWSFSQDEKLKWVYSLGDAFWEPYLPIHVEPGTPCSNALSELQDAWRNKTLWALKYIDSWGKFASGSIIGNWNYLGSYDECVNNASPDETIHGKYCRVFLRKKQGNDGTKKVDPPLGIKGNHAPFIRAPSEVINFFPSDFGYGTCIPDACTTKDFWISLATTLTNKEVEVEYIVCRTLEIEPEYSAGDIAYITLLSFFGVLLLLSSGADYYIDCTGKKHLAKGPLKFLLPFSLYTNLPKLFHLNTQRNPGTISCLHGMRVLSMTWVIYGHQQFMTFISLSNMLTFWSKINSIFFQAILNAYPSVDTFFFIGSFLVSFSVLKEVDRTGRLNVPMFYIHRLVRLLPPIGMVCGLYATISRFFVTGPFWYQAYGFADYCSENWYGDVLLVNNFIDRSCLGQCWYTSVDSQIYLLAPLFILPLFFYPSYGKFWLYLLTITSIIIPSALTYALDAIPTGLVSPPEGAGSDEEVYFKPWCRAGPWMIGIWLGYVFYRQGNQRLVMKTWQVVLGWTIAVTVGILVVFGMWSYNTAPPKAEYDVMTQILYSGLHRPAWAAALAWIVLASHNGYGGLVDDFLSHPIWQPLSRLTYSTFLVAMPMQSILADNARIPFYYTHINKIFETVAATVISMGVAVFVSLTVESPIIGLEKLLLRRPGHGPQTAQRAPENQAKQEDLSGNLGSEMRDLEDKPIKHLSNGFGIDNPAFAGEMEHIDTMEEKIGLGSTTTMEKAEQISKF